MHTTYDTGCTYYATALPSPPSPAPVLHAQVLALSFPDVDEHLDARPYAWAIGEYDPTDAGNFHRLERLPFRWLTFDHMLAFEKLRIVVYSWSQLTSILLVNFRWHTCATGK